MMEGPSRHPDFGNLDLPDTAEEAGIDKAGPSTTFPLFFESFQNLPKEKELNQFIASVLSKTSKIHQLIGEMDSKYDDARAVKYLGIDLFNCAWLIVVYSWWLEQLQIFAPLLQGQRSTWTMLQIDGAGVRQAYPFEDQRWTADFQAVSCHYSWNDFIWHISI